MRSMRAKTANDFTTALSARIAPAQGSSAMAPAKCASTAVKRPAARNFGGFGIKRDENIASKHTRFDDVNDVLANGYAKR